MNGLSDVVEFERNLISALLFKPGIIDELQIKQTDFHEGPFIGFGRLFGVIRDLIRAGVDPSDQTMLFSQLLESDKDNGESDFDRIGGKQLLSELVGNSKINFNNIQHYAIRVKEAAAARESDRIANAILAAESLEEKNRLLNEAYCIGLGDQPTSFDGVDASDLEDFASEPVNWLVTDILSSDQPILFGARSKGGKTTMLADLSVSLATNTPWLGHFAVPRLRRVLFITGESNNRAASRRIKKALSARGLGFADLTEKMRVEAVRFPQLPDRNHRDQITRIVEKHQTDVVIIDPLYRGLGGLDTNRMAEVGQAIVEFSKACCPASLVISHHSTKSAAREYGNPPELEDMTGAGIAESCGNWWLLARNEQYIGDGIHDLCVRFGGRDEQAGLKRIVFNENSWSFEVSSLAEHHGRIAEKKLDEKVRKKNAALDQQILDAEHEIKTALRNEKNPMSKAGIQTLCPRASRIHHRHAVAGLIKALSIVERQYTDNLNRRQTGWILREYVDEYDRRQIKTSPENASKPKPK